MSKTYHLFILFTGPEGMDQGELDERVSNIIADEGGEVREFLLEEQDA